MTDVTTRKVKPDEAGLRLDRWFKRHFPELPHVRLEKLLRTGQVRIDGGRAKAADRLEPGQTIRIPPTARGTPDAAPARPASAIADRDAEMIRSLVIHKDPAVIALNKPPGLASQGGSGITRSVDGLLDGLRFGKDTRPKLVHRLDRDTSGVLLIARTASAAAALSEALRAREARKIYWALTMGVPKPHRGTVRLALLKDGDEGHEKMIVLGPDQRDAEAKRAVTHYSVIDTAAQAHAFVALMPVTGRTHQLRAHMAAIGTPIVGDVKYGGPEARPGGGTIAPMLHLHARAITIRHPGGQTLSVTAELPAHMRASFALFGFDTQAAEDPFQMLGR